jgi:hypothetical protein
MQPYMQETKDDLFRVLSSTTWHMIRAILVPNAARFKSKLSNAELFYFKHIFIKVMLLYKNETKNEFEPFIFEIIQIFKSVAIKVILFLKKA